MSAKFKDQLPWYQIRLKNLAPQLYNECKCFCTALKSSRTFKTESDMFQKCCDFNTTIYWFEKLIYISQQISFFVKLLYWRTQ